MARKAKAKRVGRPTLPKGERRERRSIRLPEDLWRRLEACGEVTATVETAVRAWLQRTEE